MAGVVTTIEPLVIECPACQARITKGQGEEPESEEAKRVNRRLRVLAARGCPECHGSTVVVTDAGLKVMQALQPLIEVAVRWEVAEQLLALGYDLSDEPTRFKTAVVHRRRKA